MNQDMKTELPGNSMCEIIVPKSYNPNASSAEEHLMNLKFQLVTVDFWLSQDGQIEHARGNACAKSRCLLDVAEKLFTALRNEAKAVSEA